MIADRVAIHQMRFIGEDLPEKAKEQSGGTVANGVGIKLDFGEVGVDTNGKI
jgi:hypothetical protein